MNNKSVVDIEMEAAADQAVDRASSENQADKSASVDEAVAEAKDKAIAAFEMTFVIENIGGEN